jgi:hypothetical protein
MDPVRDTVHVMDDWYDGPRNGAADFNGVPHWYRSLYLDTDEWDPDEDRFELTPLTAEALEWIRQRFAIFVRWDEMRITGRVRWDGDDTTFGALPEEMDHSHELTRLIDDYLARTPPAALVRGTFEPRCTHVRWQLLQSL